MISGALRDRLACPVCLEAEGCAVCTRPGADHACCVAEYAVRVRCACGGPDKRRLEAGPASLDCPCCGTRYPAPPEADHADLVPRADLGAVTHYADHEFHERLEVKDAPPVLSARVKADMMRRMLAPAEGESVLDLGCGAGKLALYAQDCGASVTGVDLAPFFLPRAAGLVDLVVSDLRRLPFRKASFPAAYTLDVLEHLDEAGLADVLLEARRVLAPDGRLFVYTHAMESSRLAGFQRAVNRLARRLGAWGLIDHEREALRKSDHLNAIASHEHFETLAKAAGLAVTERRYYNVVMKAVVEDLLLRLYEHRRRRKPRTSTPPSGGGPEPARRSAPGRLALALGLALTWLLKLDVVLFGGIRTGPFFGLLRPRPGERPA